MKPPIGVYLRVMGLANGGKFAYVLCESAYHLSGCRTGLENAECNIPLPNHLPE